MIKLLSRTQDGICTYEMRSDDLIVIVSSYGVTLMKIESKDRDGKFGNVILGYPEIKDYQARSGTYFGALVGRVCNRLAKGEYTINGKTYHAAINNGPNSLHGGIDGFSYQNFESRILNDRTLMFTRLSPDGEEGYPGNMQVQAVLTIHNNKLIITLRAISDADTLCNLTMHTYFNLNGGRKDVLDHSLQLDSLRHGLVDADGLCTGQFREVIGTPLDFRIPALVRQGVDKSDLQVELANGIDHHFVLESDKDQLVLADPDSGRSVTVSTTFPGMQLYSGNYIGKCEGLDGCTYDANWGLAIEPQYLPDSIHNQQHPDALLKANELFEEKIVYTFDAQ